MATKCLWECNIVPYVLVMGEPESKQPFCPVTPVASQTVMRPMMSGRGHSPRSCRTRAPANSQISPPMYKGEYQDYQNVFTA